MFNWKTKELFERNVFCDSITAGQGDLYPLDPKSRQKISKQNDIKLSIPPLDKKISSRSPSTSSGFFSSSWHRVCWIKSQGYISFIKLVLTMKRPPHFCTWSVIWLIYARDFVIWIFSTREFVIEDSVVQRELLNILSLFREMHF